MGRKERMSHDARMDQKAAKVGRIHQPTLFDSRTEWTPAQKLMADDIVKAGTVLDGMFGGKRVGRPDTEVAQMAVSIIHEHLPDRIDSLKGWEQVQLAIEAGIRAGYTHASEDTAADIGG